MTERTDNYLKFLIFTLSFLILTRFNIDPDLGWHLAIGREFLEKGTIVRADQFSWTMDGYLWGNSYFFYQILVTYLFSHSNYLLVGLLFGLVGSLAILILLPKTMDFWKILVVGLGIVVAGVNLGIRPHMISFLFFAILLVFLEKRWFLKKSHVFWWFTLFFLWANFHRGFLVGLLILAAYLGLDYFWLKAGQVKASAKIRVFLVLAATSATLVTPFHINLWTRGIIPDLLSRENLFSIAEWQSIILSFPINLFWGLSGMIFAWVFFRKIREVEPPWFLIAAALFMLAFLAVNLASFWAAIFIFLMTRHCDFKLNLKGDFWAKLSLVLPVAMVLVALFLNLAVGFLQTFWLGNRLTQDGYPVAAVKFLKSEDLTVNLFNDYAWGGFLDWQLPGARVFIDGRMASWRKDDKSILADYLEIIGGNCEVARGYEIKTVLVKRDARLDCFSNFREVYRDSVAKILVKDYN